MVNRTIKWSNLQEILEKIELPAYRFQRPLTCYYRKAGQIIASYFCGDKKDDFRLFINKDYPNKSLLIDLIDEHCHILNQDILVYTLDNESMNLYKTIEPTNFFVIDLES